MARQGLLWTYDHATAEWLTKYARIHHFAFYAARCSRGILQSHHIDTVNGLIYGLFTFTKPLFGPRSKLLAAYGGWHAIRHNAARSYYDMLRLLLASGYRPSPLADPAYLSYLPTMSHNLMTQSLARRDIVYAFAEDCGIFASVDFAQGFGDRSSDVIKGNSSDSAYFVARSAAIELVSLGITPAAFTVGNTSFYDKASIESSIQLLCTQIGTNASFSFSHENYNRNLSETALSISAIGSQHEASLKALLAHRAPLHVYTTQYQFDDNILNPNDPVFTESINLLMSLTRSQSVVEVIPFGSRGVLHDLEAFARQSASKVRAHNPSINLRKPGGPGINFLAVSASAQEHEQSDLYYWGELIGA